MFIVVNGIHESSKGLPPLFLLIPAVTHRSYLNQSLVLLINVANLDTIFELCKYFDYFLTKKINLQH